MKLFFNLFAVNQKKIAVVKKPQSILAGNLNLCYLFFAEIKSSCDIHFASWSKKLDLTERILLHRAHYALLKDFQVFFPLEQNLSLSSCILAADDIFFVSRRIFKRRFFLILCLKRVLQFFCIPNFLKVI